MCVAQAAARSADWRSVRSKRLRSAWTEAVNQKTIEDTPSLESPTNQNHSGFSCSSWTNQNDSRFSCTSSTNQNDSGFSCTSSTNPNDSEFSCSSWTNQNDSSLLCCPWSNQSHSSLFCSSCLLPSTVSSSLVLLLHLFYIYF